MIMQHHCYPYLEGLELLAIKSRFNRGSSSSSRGNRSLVLVVVDTTSSTSSSESSKDKLVASLVVASLGGISANTLKEQWCQNQGLNETRGMAQWTIACMLALEAARMEPSRDDETKRMLIMNVDKEEEQGCQYHHHPNFRFISFSFSFNV